ncbi:MAG: hypothetical protein WBQ94_28580 [Terracidiphilus sp.]
MDPTLHSAAASIIPSELTTPPPRRPRLSRDGYLMFVIAALFLAFGLAVGSGGWMDAIQGIPNKAALRQGSSETIGAFVKWKPKSNTAVYNFTVDGKTFMGQARVPVQLLYSVGHSVSLPIRYFPANPSVNHPADWEWSPDLDWEALVFLFVPMVLPVYMLLVMRLERRLLVEGTPAVAVVTKCTSVQGGIYLKYEFCAQDGRVINGNAEYRIRQEVGTRICILYLPETPRRNLPYPPLFHRTVQ